jgi:hypothetical protein
MIIRMRGKVSSDGGMITRYPSYGKPKKDREEEEFIKRKEMEIK